MEYFFDDTVKRPIMRIFANYTKIMKKQNKNISTLFSSYAKKKTFSIFFFVCIVGVSLTVFADDILNYIAQQTALSAGSNNSLVTFSHNPAANTYYVNQWWNSTIIWNYLKGYYFDDKLGYFKLDWSTTTSENVRFVSSTEKCWTSYGYKLWGYAYSNYFWFMDFDFDNNIFVYYCEGDNKLHGYAYNEFSGFQSFNGIGFAISSTGSFVWAQSSNLFVNDTTNINAKNAYTGSDSNLSKWIGWNIFNIDDTKESIIYIIR